MSAAFEILFGEDDAVDAINAALRLGDLALPPAGTVILPVGRRVPVEVLYYSRDRHWLIVRRARYPHAPTPKDIRARERKESLGLEGLIAKGGFEVLELNPRARPFNRWERLR
jgi:hypothetical protein